MRVVLDANVLISAAISDGPSHRIVRGWLHNHTLELVVCHRLLSEVRGVMIDGSRLRKWISKEAAELYVRTLAHVADVHPDPVPGPPLTRDPDDDYLIRLARTHNAEFIVSGDADLLEWLEQDPPVLPPAEFEARLRSS